MSEHTIKYTVTPFVDFSKETLGLDITLPSGQIAREVMNLKERAIREGLIALGWTPPGIADRLAQALASADTQMKSAANSIEAGLIDEALFYVCSMPRHRKEALAAYENHKKGNTP